MYTNFQAGLAKFYPGATSELVANPYPMLSTDYLTVGWAQGPTWMYSHRVRPWLDGVKLGSDQLVQMVIDEYTKCPKTFITLMGYSQGAMVIHQASFRIDALAKKFGSPYGNAASGTTLELGIIVLADGDKDPREYPCTSSGIRAYLTNTLPAHPGPAVRPIPTRNFPFQAVRAVCNPGDLVCDFGTVFNQGTFAIGATVHTQYVYLSQDKLRVINVDPGLKDIGIYYVGGLGGG